MSDSLKIVPIKYTGGSFVEQDPVYFDFLEFDSHSITLPQTIIAQDSQKVSGRLFDKKYGQFSPGSYEGKIVTINIFHKWKTTRDKIDLLMNEDYLCFFVYDRYEEYPDDYRVCILSRDFERRYAFGEQEAEYITTLNFYECNSPNTTANNIRFQPSGSKVTFEVIIDPEGKAYKLDGLHDVRDIAPITNRFDMHPDSLKEIVLEDLYLTFNDWDNFYYPGPYTETNTTNDRFLPFSFNWSAIKLAVTPSSTSFVVNEKGTYPFKDGDRILISDGTNIDYVYCTSTFIYKEFPTDDPPLWHQLVNFDSGTISNSYSALSCVSVDPYYGKSIIVKAVIDSPVTGYDEYNLYRGVIREPFNFSGDSATLKIDNLLAEFVNAIPTVLASESPISFNDSTGSFTSSVRWTTQSGSGTLSDPTVYDGAQIGEWVITFTSSTAFNITGPGIALDTGDTSADYYDGTDATDSQIKIATSDWGGTPSSGDVVRFNVSLNIINSKAVTAARDLAITYGGLSSDFVDTTSYNFVNWATGAGEVYNFSFSSPVTIGEMMVICMNHVPGYIFQTCEGKLGFDYLKPSRVTSGGISDPLSIGGSAGVSPFFNEFGITYFWDATNNQNAKIATYPASDSDNPSFKINGRKNAIEYSLPFCYSANEVEVIAKRLYAYFAFGTRVTTTYFPIGKSPISIGSVVGETSFPSPLFTNARAVGVTFNPAGREVMVESIDIKNGDVLEAW